MSCFGYVIPAQAGIQEYMNQYYVYILASKKNGTLYIGMTSDLVKRCYEHRQDMVEGFTRKYQVHTLVYYESHNDVNEAITREKQIKKWNRIWKIRLIEEKNPQWRDFYADIL
jgi:putative endonuclease